MSKPRETPGAPRMLAIVPAFNEEESLAHLLPELHADAPGFTVLVVDDGSRDRTSDVARAHGCVVATLPFNCGIRGAVQTGFLFARDEAFDIAVQVDGDGQHPPGELASLVAPIVEGEADLVIGSRRAAGQSIAYETNAWRRFGIWSSARLISAVAGIDVTDGTSSFRAYSRKAIELFARDYPHGFLETVEATSIAKWHGLKIVEIPVHIRAREHGQSTISVGKSLFFALHASLSLATGRLRRGGKVKTDG